MREEPETIQVGMPKPRIIRAMMYMATFQGVIFVSMGVFFFFFDVFFGFVCWAINRMLNGGRKGIGV